MRRGAGIRCPARSGGIEGTRLPKNNYSGVSDKLLSFLTTVFTTRERVDLSSLKIGAFAADRDYARHFAFAELRRHD